MSPYLIVPRKGHDISRRQISPHALVTLYRLRDNGFIAYLVGGCVRDLLLKRPPKDFDVATDATPGQIKRLFRNCRLVGRRFRLAHLHFKDEIIEVSTFRAAAPPEEEDEDLEAEGRGEVPPHRRRHLKDEEGMVLRDNVFGTPEEDALRRDFTINSLAYNIADLTVIDYTGGLRDLRERVIRPIGDPEVRFREDPVRMLRAVRFAASLDFTIEPAAWEALCRLSPAIVRASPARLYEEIQKLFLYGSARRVFDLMDRSGLLEALFPRIGPWLREDPRHRQEIQTNLEGIDDLFRNGTPASPALLLAALFGRELEARTVAVSRGEGIPHQQALDRVCNEALKEIARTVAVTSRSGDGLRRILSSQPALRRMPPRRPAAVAARGEFADALAYLRFKALAGEEYRVPLAWWEAFLSGVPPERIPLPAREGTAEGKDKVRKRRRRRRRGKPKGRAQQGEASPAVPGGEGSAP